MPPDDTRDESEELDERHLKALETRFLQALEARGRGDVDGAAELLRGVLKVDPRLAEPRLELANILLETGQLVEAEDQVREALTTLQGGGRWTEDLDDSQLQSLAWGTLGEALRRRADTDDVVFGPAEAYVALVEEAERAFHKALDLDPDNEHAREWSRRFAPGRSSTAEE
jgi:tetratricopeptide (TPR) repeat protein